jgi:hypothetical protein
MSAARGTHAGADRPVRNGPTSPGKAPTRARDPVNRIDTMAPGPLLRPASSERVVDAIGQTVR